MSDDLSASERRRHPRFECQAKFVGQTGNHLILGGEVVDLSQGGAEVVFPRELQVGDRFELGLIGSSESTTFLADAEVRWVQKQQGKHYRVGCEFSEHVPEDLLNRFTHNKP